MFSARVPAGAQARDRRGVLHPRRRPRRGCSRCGRRTRATPRSSRAASRRATSSRPASSRRRRASRRCARTSCKAGIVGRLVANDFSGAIVSAQLLEQDPDDRPPGRPDQDRRGARAGARAHRARRRRARRRRRATIDVHIIGFAKVVSDIAHGALAVAMFAVVTVALTLLLVWIYIQSLPDRAGAGRLLDRRGAVAARDCWCCSATASTRSASWCRS